MGYSIDGFVGARNNNILNCADCNEIKRQSQLLFSIDLDLSEIKTKNRIVQLLLNSFSVIKFPAPTIILQDHNDLDGFIFNQKKSTFKFNIFKSNNIISFINFHDNIFISLRVF